MYKEPWAMFKIPHTPKATVKPAAINHKNMAELRPFNA